MIPSNQQAVAYHEHFPARFGQANFYSNESIC